MTGSTDLAVIVPILHGFSNVTENHLLWTRHPDFRQQAAVRTIRRTFADLVPENRTDLFHDARSHVDDASAAISIAAPGWDDPEYPLRVTIACNHVRGTSVSAEIYRDSYRRVEFLVEQDGAEDAIHRMNLLPVERRNALAAALAKATCETVVRICDALTPGIHPFDVPALLDSSRHVLCAAYLAARESIGDDASASCVAFSPDGEPVIAIRTPMEVRSLDIVVPTVPSVAALLPRRQIRHADVGDGNGTTDAVLRIRDGYSFSEKDLPADPIELARILRALPKEQTILIEIATKQERPDR